MIWYQYLTTESLTKRYLEKIGKSLIRRNDLEDALKKLDKLTHEEARMAIAELRRTAYAISENWRTISGETTAYAISEDWRTISEETTAYAFSEDGRTVSGQMTPIGDGVDVIDSRAAKIIDSTRIIFTRA